MWFLYLDESGDLGFDFENKKPSKYFTITILAIKGVKYNRDIIKAIKNTVRRKLHKKKKIIHNLELKSNGTSIEVKEYFYNQVKKLPFKIFALTLDKRKLYNSLPENKDRVYNYIARLALKKIRFEAARTQVELFIDKSKGKQKIKEFNEYITKEIMTKLNSGKY